ncbi:MAG: TIGR01777 family oxidoreductase [Flavobacteriales bacterium]
MSKVLITGGSGMIGTRLSELLLESGHEIRHLSRNVNSQKRWETFHWNPMNGEIDLKALKDIDAIIHLAGSGIADEKWTEARKKELIKSRVEGVKLLKDVCKDSGNELKQFVSAAAIGWYPSTIDSKIYTEDDARGDGFLSDICYHWENCADEFQPISKVAKLRIGVVLANEGGALPEMARPVRFFVGAGLGTGKQKVSWIHLDDACLAFKHVLENELEGIYNVVAPNSISNQDFMQTLADVIDRPIFLPNIPDFVIRGLFGQVAETVLNGVAVSSKKLQESGYHFKYPTLSSALFNIYKRKLVSTSDEHGNKPK